jgi:hypothetical protein
MSSSSLIGTLKSEHEKRKKQKQMFMIFIILYPLNDIYRNIRIWHKDVMHHIAYIYLITLTWISKMQSKYLRPMFQTLIEFTVNSFTVFVYFSFCIMIIFIMHLI